MKFLWLRDPLLKVLFEDEGIIAIDKPYGISSHTNDAKEGNEDYLIPGLIEIFERQLGQNLFIVHRLDQTTTGVFVIAKTPEAAKEYQDYFRHRETKKTYVFVTASKSTAAEFETSTPIRHKGDDLSAETQFRRLKISSKHELWQAKPLTGRNHQIRIHGAEVGLPLLGDEKYGGAKYPFLNLHCARIEFPNGVAIESKLPAYFDDLEVLQNRELAIAAHERDRRSRLFPNAETIRVINSKEKTRDRLGDFEIEYDLKSRAPGKLPKNLPESWTACENGIQFEIRRDSSPPTHGLALEHRLTRAWVKSESKDLSVLSLFSSTGGFAIAAALGGARDVTAVDAHKGQLNWSRRNLELNGVASADLKLLCRDALTYLAQCRTKDLKYDLIVVDPPNFARTDAGVFRIEEKFGELINLGLGALTERGRLLFSTASDSISFDDVRLAIHKAAPRAQIAIVQSPLDFDLPGERTRLKTFLIST